MESNCMCFVYDSVLLSTSVLHRLQYLHNSRRSDIRIRSKATSRRAIFCWCNSSSILQGDQVIRKASGEATEHCATQWRRSEVYLTSLYYHLPSSCDPLTAFAVFPRCCLDFLFLFFMFHALLPHTFIADILLSHIKIFLVLWFGLPVLVTMLELTRYCIYPRTYLSLFVACSVSFLSFVYFISLVLSFGVPLPSPFLSLEFFYFTFFAQFNSTPFATILVTAL